MDDTAVRNTVVRNEFEKAPRGMPLSAYQLTHFAPGDMTSRREELGPALAELATRQRQVLSLLYFAALDEIDVADALGISVKAVRKYAAQGIAALAARGAIRQGSLLPGGLPQDQSSPPRSP